MDITVIEMESVQFVEEVSAVCELNELQLALVGGGIGDAVPA